LKICCDDALGKLKVAKGAAAVEEATGESAETRFRVDATYALTSSSIRSDILKSDILESRDL
jgi:hypothetical protein